MWQCVCLRCISSLYVTFALFRLDFDKIVHFGLFKSSIFKLDRLNEGMSEGVRVFD